MEQYPSNTVARFRNDLDLQLDPSKRYKVCLRDITFVRSWFNFLRSGQYAMTYMSEEGSRVVTVEPGHYSISNFESRVSNRVLREGSNSLYVTYRECTLTFDPILYKFKIVFSTRVLRNKNTASEPLYDSCKLSPDLARITGFGDGTEEAHIRWDNGEDTQTHYSTHPINFDPVDMFIVQTSLIRPNHFIFGGMYPVLALVPSSSQYGQRERFEPKTPLWFDISMEEINSPEFILTTLHGQHVAFEFGPCSLSLLVREDV